jgi:ribosome-binding ATPase
MKDVAIAGLPGSGKSTVFEAVAGQVSDGPGAQAVVEVPDERVDRLQALYESKRITYAQMRVVDVGGIDPHSLGFARAADALAIVLRGFGPDADVKRDLASFRAELAVADLKTVESVMERVAKKARTGDAAAKAELEACQQAEAVLSDERWLSEEPWEPEVRAIIGAWTPLTLKPALPIVNAEELGDSSEIEGALTILAGVEGEAAELGEADAREVLDAYGVVEPAARRFARAAYRTIDLLTFYTAGPEVSRAW